MSLSMGTGNRKHVAVAAGLLLVVAALAVWEFGAGRGPARSGVIESPIDRRAAAHGRDSVRRPELSGADFHLRIGELAYSENLAYSTDGKDLFSASNGGTKVEVPLAPPRPLPPLNAAAAPAVPALPSMDLKYLGYAESGAKNMNALFLHGDDMFIARTGDIMFHRFRVGMIQTSSVQVTDLKDNRTQSIVVAAN